MTDVEQKALALVNEVAKEMGLVKLRVLNTNLLKNRTLFRAIEQHEAFRQEVSDAVGKHLRMTAVACSSLWHGVARDNLSRFIIAKPDPLVEVWEDMFPRGDCGNCVDVEMLRAAIEKRGGKIIFNEE